MTRLAEICVYHPQAALAAFEAGADRIEFCVAPELDGISPPQVWLHQIPAALRPRVMVMVRPRGGDFIYSAPELEQMRSEIAAIREQSLAGGVVFGVLDQHQQPDEAACRPLLDAAGNLETVFHRAFDRVTDKVAALKSLENLGFTRLLCGLPLPDLMALKDMHTAVTIMPGGGIRAANIHDYLRAGFAEVHSSARREDPLMPDPDELRQILEAVHV